MLVRVVPLALLATACTASSGDRQCTTSTDCGAREMCIDGECVTGPVDAGRRLPDTGPPPDTGRFDAGGIDAGGIDAGATVDGGRRDGGPADDGGAADGGPADAGPPDAPECTVGAVRTCSGGAQYCRITGRWSACRTYDGTCMGSSGGWVGCRGTGCNVCTDMLTAYPCYLDNHPDCAPNDTCAGSYFTCNSRCPAPTAADACP